MVSDENQNKHMFISVGNMISLDTATTLCLKLSRFEGPEPVRLVDRISRKMIKKMKENDYNDAQSYEMLYLSE